MRTEILRYCIHCKEEIKGKGLKYCSYEYYDAGRYGKLPTRIDRCCQRCGEPLKKCIRSSGQSYYRDFKFCSRRCAVRSLRKPKTKAGFCKVDFPKCSQCGHIFTARRINATLCSKDCGLAQRRKTFKDKYFVSVRETNPTVDKECLYCSKPFTVNYRSSVRKFCSSRCCQSFSKTERKLKKRGAFIRSVNRAAIIKRDHGMCQLCGKPVLLNKQAPHPKSPSIDHIIPISRGGTHEPRNVQLAHFLCNSIRGNRGPAQLRLTL